MNLNTFLKVAGKQMTWTSDGVYQFTGVAVSCMSYVDAWDQLNAVATLERVGYRFHIVYANNGTYFKYDGPGSEYRCMNLFVEDIENGECWLQSARLMRSAKDGKADIRYYRNMALNAPISEIEEKRQRERAMYSWRYFIVDGDAIVTAKELEEKATEKVA